MEVFTDPKVHSIESINFFTAYPTWKQDRELRHKEYVKALKYYGVNVVLGKFKVKDAYCKNCRSSYSAREEKESDVNAANVE